MVLLIRQANAADLAQLIAIWQGVGFYYRDWDRADTLGKKLALQPTLFLVAELDGTVVGGVIGTYDGWGAYINHLAASRGYQRGQRQRIEEKLLRAIEDRLRRLGVRTAFVFTLPQYQENQLYRRFGYRKWGLSCGWEKRLVAAETQGPVGENKKRFR